MELIIFLLAFILINLIWFICEYKGIYWGKEKGAVYSIIKIRGDVRGMLGFFLSEDELEDIRKEINGKGKHSKI